MYYFYYYYYYYYYYYFYYIHGAVSVCLYWWMKMHNVRISYFDIFLVVFIILAKMFRSKQVSEASRRIATKLYSYIKTIHTYLGKHFSFIFVTRHYFLKFVWWWTNSHGFVVKMWVVIFVLFPKDFIFRTFTLQRWKKKRRE